MKREAVNERNVIFPPLKLEGSLSDLAFYPLISSIRIKRHRFQLFLTFLVWYFSNTQNFWLIIVLCLFLDAFPNLKLNINFLPKSLAFKRESLVIGFPDGFSCFCLAYQLQPFFRITFDEFTIQIKTRDQFKPT